MQINVHDSWIMRHTHGWRPFHITSRKSTLVCLTSWIIDLHWDWNMYRKPFKCFSFTLFVFCFCFILFGSAAMASEKDLYGRWATCITDTVWGSDGARKKEVQPAAHDILWQLKIHNFQRRERNFITFICSRVWVRFFSYFISFCVPLLCLSVAFLCFIVYEYIYVCVT